MVRVPHHDPEQGRRVRVRQAHPASNYPEEDRGAVSLPFENLRAVSLSNRSNRSMAQTALKGHLMPAGDDCSDRLMSDRGVQNVAMQLKAKCPCTTALSTSRPHTLPASFQKL